MWRTLDAVYVLSGQLRYETALLMLSYLKNETEYLPWSAALNSLAYLESMLGASIDRDIIKVTLSSDCKCHS